MRLHTLLREAGLSVPAHVRDLEITGISSDSRTTRPGDLFVALRGLHYDGCRFVGEALARGAVFILSECVLVGENTMTVSDARVALSCLWDAWYGHPAKDMKLIGITGTNGKTSSAAMLFAILRHAGYSTGLIGTVECRCDDNVLCTENPERLANMTTPDPAELYKLLDEMRGYGASYIVMEATSHALCLGKLAPLFFERAVFTNLSPDHLDLHGDMESYFAEKKKLFSQCKEAVISCFTSYGVRLCEGLECPVRVLSDRSVHTEVHDMNGVRFSLLQDSTWLPLTINVPGRFTVENGALAALTALSLGVPSAQVQEALRQFRGVRGRMERMGENPYGVTVILDYAHTPDALEKLLLAVREIAESTQRIILLFGCGGDRDRSKRKEMGRIASDLADFVILTSDNCRGEEPEEILRDILRGIDKEKPYRTVTDRGEAIRYAVRAARRGDIVILAGKGHEEYEIRGRERLPFSERQIVADAFAQRITEGRREDSTIE